jgi:signal peptidase I
VTDRDIAPGATEPGRDVARPQRQRSAPARTSPPPPTPPWAADASDGDRGTQDGKPSRLRSAGHFLAEVPLLIVIAFVLALVLKTFFVQAFYIPSSSMEPTLAIHDRVLVNKVVHRLREPRRGEIVVFTERDDVAPTVEPSLTERFVRSLTSGLGLARPDERDFIKRITGLPGETIEMRAGVVYINGAPIPEATATEGGYLAARDLSDFGPVEIPPGEYFMMGDNRPNSADSRYSIGTVPREDIVGRAFVVIWPVSRLDTLSIAAYPVTALTTVP